MSLDLNRSSPAARPLHGDRPIENPDEDRLGRAGIVDRLVDAVEQAPREDGFVIGLTGPWGSGKTSVLRLAERQLGSAVTVLRFEPWLFSGTDQLVARFFAEISDQLENQAESKLKELGQVAARYGQAVAPLARLVFAPVGEVVDGLAKAAQPRPPSVIEARESLKAALAKAGKQILILIDDVDRLDSAEVEDVVRLVKLVADMPNLTFVLSYDRKRVEAALDKPGLGGREFLEKIVQVSVPVPPISKEQLRRITLDWLNDALGGVGDDWNAERWSRYVLGGIDGYISTMRDASRWINGAAAALKAARGEIADEDMLALEAMRVFDPDVHDLLPQMSHVLTAERDVLDFFSTRTESQKKAKEAVDGYLAASTAPDACRHLLAELFPAGADALGKTSPGTDEKRWRAERRVACFPVLARYVHQQLAADEVSTQVLSEALGVLGDPEAFDRLLADVEDPRLGDLIDRLRLQLADAQGIDVVGCAVVAISNASRVTSSPGFLGVAGERRVIWFIEDLVAAVPDDEKIQAVTEIVRVTGDLELRLQLIYRFRKPETGESNSPRTDILPQAEYSKLLSELADEVQIRSVDDLVGGTLLWWLLGAVEESAGQAAVLERLRDPTLLGGLLAQTGTELRPVADLHDTVHVDRLVSRAGESVLPFVRELAAEESLPSATQRALVKGLAVFDAQEES